MFFTDNAMIDELCHTLRCDDKKRFLRLLSTDGLILDMDMMVMCAKRKARECLLSLIYGEGCVPALKLYARLAADNPEIETPLAIVAYYFPEAYDIFQLLLELGPLEHVNTKCAVIRFGIGATRHTCPLELLFEGLSYKPHLLPWSQGNSLFKLIILLCQWETRSCFRCAQLLAPHTHGLNDIAWSYVREGRLPSLAALLLLDQEKVLAPFDSGLTIRQRIMEMVDALSSESDLDLEGAKYQSMLIDACNLFHIFERAGGALNSYFSSMKEHVPPHKGLIHIASVLKKAGYALQPIDIDLRDCYREHPELKKASLFKLADAEIPNKYLLPSSVTPARGFGSTRYSYPHGRNLVVPSVKLASFQPGDCQLFHKIKSGSMLNFVHCASIPRVLSMAAGQIDDSGSGIPRKYLYMASKLKRLIKF